MHETDTPHGFLISTQEFVPATADEFERVLRAPGSIAAWNELELSGPAGSGVPLDVGDAMEFTVNVGPLSFDYVMIVAARTSGVSFIQRTTKGFVDVTIEYSWKTQGWARWSRWMRCTASRGPCGGRNRRREQWRGNSSAPPHGTCATCFPLGAAAGGELDVS